MYLNRQRCLQYTMYIPFVQGAVYKTTVEKEIHISTAVQVQLNSRPCPTVCSLLSNI